MEPLDGYRIVDFGTALVGGVAPRMLAELGAEVIKVESRARLDGFRLGRPVLGDEATQADESLWIELQPSMQSAGRDKLSVTLNMNQPEGLDLVKRLIAKSDAAMNNYSPGVLQRRGLDYESLRAIKPDIIVLSMPGAGETGPLRDYVSYAMTAEALSGMGRSRRVRGWPAARAPADRVGRRGQRDLGRAGGGDGAASSQRDWAGAVYRGGHSWKRRRR